MFGGAVNIACAIIQFGFGLLLHPFLHHRCTCRHTVIYVINIDWEDLWCWNPARDIVTVRRAEVV